MVGKRASEAPTSAVGAHWLVFFVTSVRAIQVSAIQVSAIHARKQESGAPKKAAGKEATRSTMRREGLCCDRHTEVPALRQLVL